MVLYSSIYHTDAISQIWSYTEAHNHISPMP
ncbi:hypothetical protein F383_38715 [Gossypium arboreum]|uniref:Uncharacterized protein n=1 Tax=Gossypium arboreum TaxID=29729 RepID=A0A0B0MKE1_GOSAR|nr:hypothetical protein F383_38715 [Gossypium arboreum]